MRFYPFLLALFILSGFMPGLSLSQAPVQSQRMLDLFKAAENGQTLIMMTYRDSVLYPMYEARREMTRLYGVFWENEPFYALKDLNVDILPDGSARAGIVIVMEMRQKVALKDPGFEMHRRFGRMLVSYAKNRAGKQAPILWKVAVDTTWGDDNVRRSAVASVFGMRQKIIYQEPDARDSLKLADIQERGGQSIALPAIDVAYLLASNYVEGFEKLYAPALQFDGFKYGADASLALKRNPIDQNSLLLLFTVGRRVARTDPQLGMHKSLAEKMLKQLNEEMRFYAPPWLDFKAAADTTAGRDPYVLLVSYVR